MEAGAEKSAVPLRGRQNPPASFVIDLAVLSDECGAVAATMRLLPGSAAGCEDLLNGLHEFCAGHRLS